MAGLCTLELFKGLFGDRRSLDRVCAYAEVPHNDAHSAKGDALATAHLVRKLIAFARKEKVGSLRQLMEKFPSLESLLNNNLPPLPSTMVGPKQIRLQSRAPSKLPKVVPPMRRYLEAVVDALADFKIEPQELEYLHELRADLGLPPNRQRAVHAKVFNVFLSRYSEDQDMNLRETRHLAHIYTCLQELGWAPGQDPGY